LGVHDPHQEFLLLNRSRGGGGGYVKAWVGGGWPDECDWWMLGFNRELVREGGRAGTGVRDGGRNNGTGRKSAAIDALKGDSMRREIEEMEQHWPASGRGAMPRGYQSSMEKNRGKRKNSSMKRGQATENS